MARVGTILLLLLGLLVAPALYAQPDGEGVEDMEFDVKRQPYVRDLHPSETEKYREVGIGEWGVAWNVFYTARSYNISHIKGLDNSLASSWLYSFDPWGLGFRAHIEHRVSQQWHLSLLPSVDVAGGILNVRGTNTHKLRDLPFDRNYSGANDQQKLSVNFELEFSARWRFMWFTAKFNSWAVFRRRAIRAHDTDFRDPQLGTLSPIEDRKRVDWEQAYVYGASTGVGFEFFFLPESTRFIFFAMYRPFNHVQFRDDSAVTHGLELVIRSADFRLSNQVGLFFEVSMQLYLPTREFNDVYYTQFSLGIKFR